MINHPVEAYLSECEQKVFDPGCFDCAVFVADWVQQATGIDPAGSHRGRWTSLAMAMLRAERAGGVETLARKLARDAGLHETDDPGPGDIGLHLDSAVDGQPRAGAFVICAPPMWWGVAEMVGLAATRARPQIMWAVPWVER